ncbi:hypothetical protein T492DRAFT_834700 [Pavlovales sp. CCMP2436]|nr:hypothetical protein T492DRAFT_834700 [Pavlovales sp. CCMP2436]
MATGVRIIYPSASAARVRCRYRRSKPARQEPQQGASARLAAEYAAQGLRAELLGSEDGATPWRFFEQHEEKSRPKGPHFVYELLVRELREARAALARAEVALAVERGRADSVSSTRC